MISFHYLKCLLILPLFLALPAGAADFTERKEWAAYFEEAATQGTFVLYDLRENAWTAFNADRAKARFIPASTFKIPNSLIALETGVIKSTDDVFPWDGTKRKYEDWNRDHTLRTAMKYSVVPVYQSFARAIGAKRMKDYLERFAYGNQDIGEKIDMFWLEGPLAISAVEQIHFLVKLYRNALPVSKENQLIVKDVLINEASREFILRAKTGLGDKVGWWVGWVERDNGVYFFALNIDVQETRHINDRLGISKAILKAENILPEQN
jgi:beta-lactamase class D OXA-48